MAIFEIVLVLSTFLCSLVAGFLFAFAVVAMPGISSLKDREFVRAFQVMDGVIQDNQPVFLLAWVGSVVVLTASVILGIGMLDGVGRWLMVLAALAYLVGVQLPTIAINIPLNKKLQALNVDAVSEQELGAARADFEARWNRWNSIRAAFAGLTSVLLIILVYGL